MEKQKQAWKRTLSGTLALLTAIAAMPAISLSAAAEETGGGLSADDEEIVLREMNISTEPIDLSDTDKNPYTAGVDKITTLFPHHELSIRDNVNDDWGGKNKVHTYNVDYGRNHPVWDSENRYETSQTASLAANSESVGIDLNGVGRQNYTASMVYYPNGVLDNGVTQPPGDYLEIRDYEGDLYGIMSINDEVTDDHWYWAGSIEGRNEIASGDFDGDGNDDLALLDREDGNIDILYDVSIKSWAVSYSRFRSIGVESINSLIDKDTVRYQTQFAVGDLNGDMVDDLVITAFNDYECGYSNMMVPVTVIYTGTKGGDLQKAASFTHQWNLTAYNPQNASNQARKGAYGSAAIGDVDNDGKSEVVLASWKQKSSSTADTDTNTGIDFNQALVSMIEYDSKTKSFVAGAGGVAHTVYTNSALDSGTYNGNVQANIPLACFNPYGSGHCDLMFISGDIFSFGTGEDGYQYDNIISLSNGHPAMGFGFKKEYTPYIFPQNDKCYFGSDSAKSTNIWVGTYTVGNFENDSNGGQQLIFEHGRKKDSKTHYRHDLIEVYFDQAEGKLKDRSICINNDTSTGRNTNLDLCAFDYDQDSLQMKFTGKKYYFSDPQVSAIFQAAPYFDELTDMDGNYQTNGETVFGKATGSGTELGNSFSVSAGIIAGYEEDVSFLGLYDIGGIEITTELSASMGGEFTSSEEKTYSSEYSSTADEDRVLLSMIPYTVYEYEMYLPAFKIPTQSEYQQMEDGPMKQAVESAIKKGKQYGESCPAGWHYYSTSVPSQPRMSMITVTKYDQIANEYGFEPIRGNILNHTLGNPATYSSTSEGLRNFDGGRNAADNSNFVNVTEGGTVTEAITKSTSSSKGMTWGTALDFEEKINFMGAIFGCSTSYEYNGSYAWTDYSETSCSGTVAGLPSGAPNLGYDFKWQFGQWNDTLNGQDCLVLGYLTQGVKRPLPMPKDICVKDATDKSITFEFTPHMYETVIERYNPKTGSVYVTEVAPAGVSEYTFTKTLKADTEYTFRMFSSKPGTNERSLYTNLITARTGYAPDANVPRVEIDDVVVQLGQDAVITAVLTPAVSDEDVFYVFQKFDPENNTWKKLSTNSTLFDGTNPTLTIPSVTELDNNTKYRLCVEQDVDNDTKIIYSATATLGIGDPVDVTFQPNNGTDAIIKHIASGNNVSIPATPQKANYTFAGWFTDEACTNEFDATQPITANITVYAKWTRTTPATFMRKSVSLGGAIGVNFFMDLDGLTDEEKAAGYMEFTVSGDTTTAAFDPNFKNTTNQYYGFTCRLSAIQMADTITATYHYGDNETATFSYSVQDYLDTFTEADPEKMRNLAYAINDYGYYAQLSLSKSNGWTIGEQHEGMNFAHATSYDVNAITAALENSNKQIVRNLNSDIQKVNYTLRLDSNTEVLLFIKPAQGYQGNVDVTVNGTSYAAELQSDGRYKVTISNIAAHKLGDMFNVKIATNSGESTVQVSAMSYAYDCLKNPLNQEESDAMAALYHYYDAAMTYIK